MKILISNDDGIQAPGLNALLKPLRNAGHEIIVVAPNKENSAISHAITVHDPIFVDNYVFADFEDIKAWTTSGKPADCVKIALEVLLDEKPDLVVSGINHGANMGLDTIYSGTVSAALEASIHKTPAVAFSLDTRTKEADFSTAAQIAVEIIDSYNDFKLPKTSILNVNIPYVKREEIKGKRIVDLADIAYDNIFVPRTNLKGRTYYWLGGEVVDNPVNDINTDLGAVAEKWVSITPLQYDLTDHNSLDKLKNKSF